MPEPGKLVFVYRPTGAKRGSAPAEAPVHHAAA
jgi:hypothetical protein